MSGTYEVGQHPGGTVACIGVFDGVHKGHQALIGRARGEANRAGLPLVAVTFDPHPEAVIRPGHAPQSLATVGEPGAAPSPVALLSTDGHLLALAEHHDAQAKYCAVFAE